MPSPQSKDFGKSDFQCAVHKSDTIASFHFTLLRAAGKSQDQSLPLWAAFDCGEARRQAHEQHCGQQEKKGALLLECGKHNTHLSELPQSGSTLRVHQLFTL